MKAPKLRSSKPSVKAVKTAKQPKVEAADQTLSALRAPWLLAYHYLGLRIQKYLPYFADTGVTMQKAALKISLQSYVSMLVLLSGVSTIASFVIVATLVAVAGGEIWLSLLYAFGAAIGLGAMVFAILYFLPSLLASSRRKRMDLELPYVASHMSILAAASIPPTRMFKLLEDSKTTPEVASDANEVVRDVEVLGNDIMTALESERDRSPSRIFADVLEGLVATIRSGGNMKSYLLDATHTIMDLRRIAGKQLIESLAVFAETYVTLMIVFPLLIIVMFSVMALIGSGLGGMSVTLMMSFVTYGIIPICGMAVIVMLDSMLVED
ncbi:MAG: type II secretion system F family protein [Candidatus Bathyarchaeia archaeon]